MAFDPDDTSRDQNDYFESPATPPEPPKPREPEPDPDDPRYWEREESEWEHLNPSRRLPKGLLLWGAGAAVVTAVLLTVWLRWFAPYVDHAVQYGYVDHIERTGDVFKTYEGILIPYKELMDTTRVYRHDFVFSALNDSVAAQLLLMQRGGVPVCVEYRRYHGALPWRGRSATVVVAVDTADPRKILPPEYNPDYKQRYVR